MTVLELPEGSRFAQPDPPNFASTHTPTTGSPEKQRTVPVIIIGFSFGSFATRTAPMATSTIRTLAATKVLGRIVNSHYIVDQDLFDRVQRVLYGERRAGLRHRVHEHYLKGVVWCGRCKTRLVIIRGKSKNGDHYFYYLCRGRQEDRCDLPYLPAQKVEKEVLSHYSTVCLPDDFRARVTQLVDDASSQHLATRSATLARLKKRLTELGAKEDALLDLVGDPAWPKEKLFKRMQDLHDERAKIEAQLARDPSALGIGRQNLLDTLELLANPQELYRTADVTAKQILNKAIFTKLYVDAVAKEPQVVADEVREPFATAVEANRREQSAGGVVELGQSDTMSATPQSAACRSKRTAPSAVLTQNRIMMTEEDSGDLDPVSVGSVDLLLAALNGRCSSKGIVVHQTRR
ncbi:MAG TPA: zinc ribbon domain-containing protein [Candidatus Saccharimonadales bacterium]|nr:zinc ribbon domain-containing protein [Candidatus Saccharimonadales bacterium]